MTERKVQKAYTIRQIRQMGKKYVDRTSNITIEGFLNFLQREENKHDQRINKLYGL